MFDDIIGCILEKAVYEEFIFIMTSEEILAKKGIEIFDLVNTYKHIINCDIHNTSFTDYINYIKRSDTDPSLLLKNIKILSYYFNKDEISTTN